MRYAEYVQVAAYTSVQKLPTRTIGMRIAFMLGPNVLTTRTNPESHGASLVRPSQGETPRPRAHADVSFGGLGVFIF